MTLILTDEGYHVNNFYDAGTALKKYKKGFYNIIVTDNLMPEITGVEFIERANKKEPGIPSIIISAQVVTRDARLKKLGVVKIFEKPFNIEELIKYIKRLKKH